jgi:eukaryotic-like serine/threonine-protein kinase
MADMLNAYKYEKQLSDLCKTSHVTKVVYVNEAGEETIPGYTIPVVPYLIFDLADGDVRSRLEFSDGLDFAWRLKSLHDISIGIRQLHKIEISHQDLKPSNILVFDTSSKIGDLGRSVCRLVNGPYDEMCFSGDFTYAPPEIMYKYFEKDWSKRVFATDCYLLGSMVVFYFAGTSMSAPLQKNLPDKFKVHVYRGPFDQIRPYLLEAFSISLDEFKNCISNAFFKEELGWVVERLCYPLPENRGHSENLCGIQNQFSLERFVSKFHHLHIKAEYLIGK